MVRRLMALLVISTLVVSCSSSKKKGDGDLGSDISSKDMSFDPSGSDSGNISGLSTINFDYDKAALTSQARELLKGNADWIRSNTGVTVQIEGHCDNRGSIEYNLALGERRANAVKAYLVSIGVPSDRMNIISFGEEKPLADGDSEMAHSKNRRANFVPIPN